MPWIGYTIWGIDKNTTLQNINNIINIITSKFSKFKEKMQGGERFRG